MKFKISIAVLCILLLLNILGGIPTYCASLPPTKILFSDKTLEASIREAINIPTGDIYATDAAKLESLWIQFKKLENISALKYFTGLKDLHLLECHISDISVLQSLTNLTSLSIDGNKISDITPLKNLKKLQVLEMNNNGIKDIKAVEGLTSLHTLRFSKNSVEDISPVRKLNRLLYLDAEQNYISNISPVYGLENLLRLGLRNNLISDVSKLAPLKYLQSLTLGYNCLQDTKALNIVLSGMKQLKEFEIEGNPIEDISALKPVFTRIKKLSEFDKSQALAKKAASVTKSIIKADMLPIEKELAIHDYIVSNTDYDDSNKNSVSGYGDRSTACGPLLMGKAVCDGYAHAMLTLCRFASLECRYVQGYALGGNTGGYWECHAWNIIRLNGSWYNVDATWDDPAGQNAPGRDWFNVKDAEMWAHRWIEGSHPACIESKYGYITYMNAKNGQTTQYAKIQGSLALPDNEKAPEDGILAQLSMTYADAGSPVYKSLNVNIGEGENAAAFSFDMPVSASNVKIIYNLYGATAQMDEYSRRRYLNSTGYVNLPNITSSDMDNIRLIILKGNLISGTISLSDGEISNSSCNDICWMYFTSVSGNNMVSPRRINIIKGQNSVEFNAVFPDKGSYYISYSTILPGYNKDGYYSKAGVSTQNSSADAVSLANGDVTGIQIKLLKSQKSSTFSADSFRLLIQTDSPYALMTNAITGEVNVLKKNDTTVSMFNDRNMMPAKWAEYLGYEVTWHDTTKTAILSHGDQKVSLTVGSKIMSIDETGKETVKVEMDVAVQMDKNGSAFIPIDYFVLEAMCTDIQWEEATKTIGINYPNDEFTKAIKTYLNLKDTATANDASMSEKTYNDSVFGNNILIKVGGNYEKAEISYSTPKDGLKWTQVTGLTSPGLRSVVFGKGLFVAVGYKGVILYSADGKKWSKANCNKVLPELRKVVFGREGFVAIGDQGMAAFSADGKNWTFVCLSKDYFSMRGLTYWKSSYLAVDFAGNIYKSVDGKKWTKLSVNKTVPKGYEVLELQGNSEFCMILLRKKTEFMGSMALLSSDLKTWSLTSMGIKDYGITSVHLHNDWFFVLTRPKINANTYGITEVFVTKDAKTWYLPEWTGDWRKAEFIVSGMNGGFCITGYKLETFDKFNGK